jgi:hypothetical protein
MMVFLVDTEHKTSEPSFWPLAQWASLKFDQTRNQFISLCFSLALQGYIMLSCLNIKFEEWEPKKD